MKISLNNAQSVSNIDLNIFSKDELVIKIGEQLGAVEETIDWGAKYKGVVIVRVVKCDPHPNADKLNVCKIDDGGAVAEIDRDSDGYVQVVCGAPNVRKDMIVAWIPPGSVVPSTYGTKDQFVLGSKELRGVLSNGMLASAAELGISDNHDGLLEIDDSNVTVGNPLIDLYGLNDFVIDVENKMFTHRPDCFGVLGVAREIAGINNQQFVSPEWYLNMPKFNYASGLDLNIEVNVDNLCPRFMAVAIKDISIMPSPIWLQSALNRVGIRPINNVVDATNWIMYVTGQPTHAYDYDKVASLSDEPGAKIVVRHPNGEENLTLINGKIIIPRQESVAITSGPKLLGLAGVMGGLDSEVDENTKNIILEVASFNMYSIRKTSMHHGLFTDAVTRFNKGQSVHQNDRVMARLMDYIYELAGGVQASNVIDIKSDLKENGTITIDASYINERLGINLNTQDILAILKNVEFEVSASEDSLNVKAPFWRTDIAILEDVVEEVGRLYGYDKLPLNLPVRQSAPSPKNKMLDLKSSIRQVLARAGANELLTYSFVHGDLMKKIGQDTQQAYSLANALSPNLQYYRLNITPSLLDKVHHNHKAGFEEFAIFELGKTHNIKSVDQSGLPKEDDALALVYSLQNNEISLKQGPAYYRALTFFDFVAQQLNLKYSLEITDEAPAPFAPKRTALIRCNENVVGYIGEYTQKAIKSLKLPESCAGFELNLNELSCHLSSASNYQPLSKYPKVEQDVSIKVESNTEFAKLYSKFNESINDLISSDSEAKVQCIDIYQPEGSYKNITFRVSIVDYNKTLQASEVNSLLDKSVENTSNSFFAERV
jgi:phenylalanyl-tRNA synthetase beta chain